MSAWIGAALLGLVGDGDDSTTATAHEEESTVGAEPEPDAAATGPVNETEIAAAPAIEDEPVFTARDADDVA